MASADELVPELGRLLRKAQSEWRAPSVCAAVVHGDELVWSEAIGVADVETGEEATPEHQYRIGSITKTFTAAAIMLLRDEGKLDLDDRLDRHVEGAAHGPTLRRLLTHTSGLQREPPGEIWEKMQFLEGDEFLATLAEAEEVLPAGSRWHYSNLAFALLGEVVARVGGAPWEQFLRERILQPLGLTRTTLRPHPPFAKGYFVEPYFDGVRPERSDAEIGATAPAGALWSTTADLGRWAAFLSEPNEGVLSAETVEEMQTFQAMAELERWTLGSGLGLQLFRRDDRIFAGHGGAMPGFLAVVAASRKERTGAVVLANSSAAAKVEVLGLELAVKAAEAFPPEPEPWRVGEAPPPELEKVLGRWWSEGREFVFRWRAGALEATLAEAPPGMPPAVFRREDDDRYRTISGLERGELLRIVRDDDGSVSKLYWATYPFTREAQIFGA